MSIPQKPHYLKPLAELVRQCRDQIKAGQVYETRVAHDAWCGIFDGRACNCNPEVTLFELVEPSGPKPAA